MTIEIDYDKAIELLERAVAEKGADYVYASFAKEVSKNDSTCLYVDPETGAPSCIVGHVVSYLDSDLLPEISEWETEATDDTTVFSLAGRLEDRLHFTERALATLTLAQQSQDNGITWGRALEYAR